MDDILTRAGKPCLATSQSDYNGYYQVGGTGYMDVSAYEFGRPVYNDKYNHKIKFDGQKWIVNSDYSNTQYKYRDQIELIHDSKGSQNYPQTMNSWAYLFTNGSTEALAQPQAICCANGAMFESFEPTTAPSSSVPTRNPTKIPTSSVPTAPPTSSVPTAPPTSSIPTKTPSSSVPTRNPTKTPTSSVPTEMPTSSVPTKTPTGSPTSSVPTQPPTSSVPTFEPTRNPTRAPSGAPTVCHAHARDILTRCDAAISNAYATRTNVSNTITSWQQADAQCAVDNVAIQIIADGLAQRAAVPWARAVADKKLACEVVPVAVCAWIPQCGLDPTSGDCFTKNTASPTKQPTKSPTDGCPSRVAAWKQVLQKASFGCEEAPVDICVAVGCTWDGVSASCTGPFN